MNNNDNQAVSASQTARIFSHMLEGKSITSLDAFYEFGCTRLPARIKDIEHQYGFTASRERVQVKNREGKDVYVMKYWI